MYHNIESLLATKNAEEEQKNESQQDEFISHNQAYRLVYQELSDLFDNVSNKQEQIDILKQNKHLRYIQQQLATKSRQTQLDGLLSILNNKFQLAIAMNEDLHFHETTSLLTLATQALLDKSRVVSQFMTTHEPIIADYIAKVNDTFLHHVVHASTLGLRILNSFADQNLVTI